MTSIIKKVDYTTHLSLKAKRLNIRNIHQYHLAISLGSSHIRICCIDQTTYQCLLLQEYRIKEVWEKGFTTFAEQIFYQEPLLNASHWSAITLCIQNQTYTLIPTQMLQKNNIEDYLKLACPITSNTDIVKHFTHQYLGVAMIFSMNKSILNWFESTYRHTRFQVIHQGSSFIASVWMYLKTYKPTQLPVVFVFGEPAHIHVIVIQNTKLLYYNRFMYQDSDEFLSYILIVMQTLNLNPNLHQVIFLCNITKNSLAYRKACNYIKQIILGKSPVYFKLRHSFKKKYATYLDLFNVFFCQKGM